MKYLLLLLLALAIQMYNGDNYKAIGSDLGKNLNDTNCISKEELKLYHLIMSYRKQKKLPLIPLSISLTKVAKAHAKDLMENHPNNDPCNMHSWSDKGTWKKCCYTPDHKQKECMWNKPKELSNYPSEGFEVAYFFSGGAVPEAALESWKNSSGHNPVLVNLGIWKNMQWNAIGVGIYKNYAAVWFGHSIDIEGAPENCR